MDILQQLELPPIHKTLAGHDLKWDAQTQTFNVKYIGIEAFTNPRGHIEGGMLCAMLDDAMGLFAVLSNDGHPATTINLTMDFLRPCTVGEISVTCQYLRRGNKILNIDAVALQNNKIVARSTANFLVLNK